MKRTKRHSATATAAVKAMVNAGKPPHQPPAHVRLRPEDQPFWEGIVRAKAYDEWGECDLVIAAQLARCQRDIEVESLVLEQESTVIENKRGTMVCNPRVSVLEQLARREMALMRSLRMAGTPAAAPRLDHLVGERTIERQSRALTKELEDEEELLAR